ncbi:MAG: UDP-N-acetylglucosamine pyrophosphorylase [Clostridia bacterium]|nr:UDP-N-acetylglucosamine pyrophosphorylase [Clostridia bacterium]
MKNGEVFLELDASLAKPLFLETAYPWEVLPRIKAFILSIGPSLPPSEYEQRDGQVWVHRSARLFPNIYIAGPCIIGPNSELRPGAFIRGSVLVGADCVVGNSTELKNCILFDHVQAPHYNYVGDSIMGHYAHTGAGVICSNVKSDKTLVSVNDGLARIPTGLKKFGAIIGDHVEVGCNSVLCPGTVLLPYASVYPLSRVRGVVKARHIYKAQGEIVQRV